MSETGSPLLHCYRCIYSWYPRSPVVRICPRCKSKYWNVPKIRSVELGDGLGIDEIIAPKRRAILRLARRYGARNVRVFGSVRRREARPDSDVDLLVEWSKRRTPTARFDLEAALRKVLHRSVDVAAQENLSWYVIPTVLSEAVPV